MNTSTTKASEKRNLTISFSTRISPEQRDQLEKLGGSRWIRKQIDTHAAALGLAKPKPTKASKRTA